MITMVMMATTAYYCYSFLPFIVIASNLLFAIQPWYSNYWYYLLLNIANYLLLLLLMLSPSLWHVSSPQSLFSSSSSSCPSPGVAYDELKEQKSSWETKQKELKKIEEAKKKEAEKGCCCRYYLRQNYEGIRNEIINDIIHWEHVMWLCNITLWCCIVRLHKIHIVGVA